MRIIINYNINSYTYISKDQYLFQELFYVRNSRQIDEKVGQSFATISVSSFVETRSIIVPTNETGTTCTSTKHIHNSSNVATLAKRRFAPTNRANRPLLSNDRCSSTNNIFQPTRILPFPTRRPNIRDLRLLVFFFTRFDKSRAVDPRASIIPRRAFNRGVQFALRPARFLPLGENGRRSPSFPTINNPATRVILAPRFGSVNLDPFPRFGIQGILTRGRGGGGRRGRMRKVNLRKRLRFNDGRSRDY